MDNNITLYQIADAEIRKCIDAYLKLARETHGLSIAKEQHLVDQRLIVILLAGLGIRQFNVTEIG